MVYLMLTVLPLVVSDIFVVKIEVEVSSFLVPEGNLSSETRDIIGQKGDSSVFMGRTLFSF